MEMAPKLKTVADVKTFYSGNGLQFVSRGCALCAPCDAA